MEDRRASAVYHKKQELREILLKKRAAITPEERTECDNRILHSLTALPEYQNCTHLFTYVSFRDEVDTRALIEQALISGRKVAVPRCIPGTPRIEFYFITSLSQLTPGSFEIPEPKPELSRLAAVSLPNALCVVPGLSFDRQGNRLGYGKGYYDRFLSGFKGFSVGLCYTPLLSGQPLPAGRFDARIPVVITDTDVLRV